MDPAPKREDYDHWKAYVNNYALWITRCVNTKGVRFVPYGSTNMNIKLNMPSKMERLFLAYKLLQDSSNSELAYIIIGDLFKEQEHFNKYYGVKETRMTNPGKLSMKSKQIIIY